MEAINKTYIPDIMKYNNSGGSQGPSYDGIGHTIAQILTLELGFVKNDFNQFVSGLIYGFTTRNLTEEIYNCIEYDP